MAGAILKCRRSPIVKLHCSREARAFFLNVVGRLLEKRDAPAAYAVCDGIGEKPHHPWQVDLDAHGVIGYLDATGDPLPRCHPNKMEGVVLPVVIELPEDDAELGLQLADAGIEPSSRFLPAELLWDRNDHWSRHRISLVAHWDANARGARECSPSPRQ